MKIEKDSKTRTATIDTGSAGEDLMIQKWKAEQFEGAFPDILMDEPVPHAVDHHAADDDVAEETHWADQHGVEDTPLHDVLANPPSAQTIPTESIISEFSSQVVTSEDSSTTTFIRPGAEAISGASGSNHSASYQQSPISEGGESLMFRAEAQLVDEELERANIEEQVKAALRRRRRFWLMAFAVASLAVVGLVVGLVVGFFDGPTTSTPFNDKCTKAVQVDT